MTDDSQKSIPDIEVKQDVKPSKKNHFELKLPKLNKELKKKMCFPFLRLC